MLTDKSILIIFDADKRNNDDFIGNLTKRLDKLKTIQFKSLTNQYSLKLEDNDTNLKL